MDPNATPQTVAQAVQAATQQQAQQISHPSPPVQPVQGAQSSAVDNLTCQWQGCGERCDTPEALYDHVCERHVGRKSTNNLNLTCLWGACRTTTVKRDHITSHIRVHVPLKPHKCDFCGKAFKRPQDLKKHVKTHADDSVLMNSPSQAANGGRGNMGGAGGMGQQNNKPSAYYPTGPDHSMTNPYPTYQPNMGPNGANNGAYHQPTNNGQYAGYGSVNYPNNSAVQDLGSLDTRRRAIEALNDFLGDIKRRAIDPGNYYDVGHRLQSTALPLPIGGSGYNTGYNNSVGFSNYNSASLLDAFTSGGQAGGGGSGLQGDVATQGYGLPLPNARTKNDFQDIDRFLAQLQATVYETSNHAAAAGIQQPGVHAMHTGDFGFNNNQFQSYRSSNSPQNSDSGMSGTAAISAVSNPGMNDPTSAFDTPALTPASVSSYNSSGQSPMSSHSRTSLGYPALPSVTGISDIGAGYPTTTSAPASSLASGFEGLDGRRRSGGRLQRQAPNQDTEMRDAHDAGARTPKATDSKRPKSKGNSSIDPALRGEDEKSSSDSASTPAGMDGAEDKRTEQWVENMRVIEALRRWVADSLSGGDYLEEEGSGDAKEGADSAKSIEIAKMVEEKLADADRAEEGVKYPSLPSN